MRPILLEMHGFASFREQTSVDFTDADFFALVGPTGAGKSTVIDAMTFALYGSVPRWGRKGMVSLALAPTVTRGTVKLIFEVGQQRYVVARELRRAGSQVQQRAASLERLADPAGMALPGDQTVPLAKDLAGMTDAIEKLLGLSYEDFCQCVVLPQGQFADFLHAKPADRQEILLRLLGAEHYRRMMEKANQRANTAAQRADFIMDQMVGYADATPAAQDQARAVEAALVLLAAQVDIALPRIREAQQELSAADDLLRRLQAEQGALALVRIPDGTSDLDDRLTASREDLRRLGTAERGAEDADAAARSELAAAPKRAPLLLARQQQAESDRKQALIPGLEDDATRLTAISREATTLAREAEKALDGFRDQRDEASRSVSAATDLVSRLEGQHRKLAAVAVPAQVTALDKRHVAAATAAADAIQALEEAERAEAAARAVVGSAVPEAPLAHASRDLDELRGVLADLTAGRAAASVAHEEKESAAAALSRVREAHDDRQRDLDDANRAHVVAGLRPHLTVGGACPVCEQTVGTLPAPVHAPELATARARLLEAEHALAAAQKLAEQAGKTVATTEADLAAKLARHSDLLRSLAGTLRGPLSGAPLPATLAVVAAGVTAEVAVIETGLVASALGEVTALAQARTRLEQAAKAAADAARAARERDRSAQADARQAEDNLTGARSALRAARDPLVELGAPQLDEASLAAGWASLARWATQQATSRTATLAAAREAATATEVLHQAAAVEFTEAEQTLAQRRVAETAATRDEQRASAELGQVTARVVELGELLRDAPGEAEITEGLRLLDRLEAAADEAGKALLDSRRKRVAQEQALAGLEHEEAVARAALSAARDPVVALGAPAVDGLGLLAGWTVLEGWAGGVSVIRGKDIEASSGAVARARQVVVDLAGRLQADLAREGIELATEALAASAAPAVASAVADARAAAKRVAERRAEAAALADQQQQAQEQQQVARMLGDLLRADHFQRWLVSEAVEDLVTAASETLSRLSSGQYDLAYDGGDFYVIDHADADSRRSARTLSGGETFQASLALALALSSQISALATAGAARLDSIFLDEGFGTLDPETLDVVATTLETLAQGDRMVGVVTHVAALAERVPVRFRVTRNAQSSTITREGFGTELAEEAME
ncbi:MAG TPA: SMC family ATPase [Trebonia sp.]